MAEILSFNQQKVKPAVRQMRKAQTITLQTKKQQKISDRDILDFIWTNADLLDEKQWDNINQFFSGNIQRVDLTTS